MSAGPDRVTLLHNQTDKTGLAAGKLQDRSEDATYAHTEFGQSCIVIPAGIVMSSKARAQTHDRLGLEETILSKGLGFSLKEMLPSCSVQTVVQFVCLF